MFSEQRHMKKAFETNRYYRCTGIPKALNQTTFLDTLAESLDLTSDEKKSFVVVSLIADARNEDTQTAVLLCKAGTGPKEWKRSGLTVDSSFLGFTTLRSDEESTVDVIAVPGLGGHAIGSFKEPDGTYLWLLHIPSGARVLTYGYDSKIHNSGSFQSWEDMAEHFTDGLRRLRKGQVDNERRPIIIIAHSMGGVVIKRALHRMYIRPPQFASTLQSVHGLLFFGVPSTGMATDHLVSIVLHSPNREVVLNLTAESSTLRDLHDMFCTALPPEAAELHCFYETRESPILQLKEGRLVESAEQSVRLVPQSSATKTRGSEDTTNWHSIDKPHNQLTKFSADEAERSLGSVLDVLQHLYETAAARIRHQSSPLHRIIYKNELLRSPNEVSRDYYSYMTNPALDQYRQVYLAIKEESPNTTLQDLEMFFSCHQDIWPEIRHFYSLMAPKMTSIVTRHATMAVLYTIHMATAYPHIKRPELTDALQVRLERFDKWVLCPCDSSKRGCTARWNLVDGRGLFKDSPKELQHAPCKVKKYLNSKGKMDWKHPVDSLISGSAEKAYKKVKEIWLEEDSLEG